MFDNTCISNYSTKNIIPNTFSSNTQISPETSLFIMHRPPRLKRVTYGNENKYDTGTKKKFKTRIDEYDLLLIEAPPIIPGT